MPFSMDKAWSAFSIRVRASFVIVSNDCVNSSNGSVAKF